MPRKKFLLLSSYTYPDSSGSGINAFNFATALTKNGYNARVLSFKRSRNNAKNPSIIRIPYFYGTTIAKLLSVPIIIFYYLFHIAKADVLFVYGNKIIGWQLAIIIAKVFRTKVFFRSLLSGVDDLDSILSVNRIQSNLYKKLFNSIDYYFSINDYFTECWLKNTGKQQALFQSLQGVDTERFYPAISITEKIALRQKLKLESESYLLISSGFLIERKGYGEVFQSIAKLEVPFKYIHTGEYKFGDNHFLRNNNIEAQKIYKKGKILLKNKIVFKGFVSNIDEYLKCADVFIHGKATEGFPNVFLEAMASGLPIVTSPIIGTEGKLLRDRENCIIYRNETELRNAILELRQNEQLRKTIVTNAFSYIRNNASFSKVIQKIEPLINQ